MKLNITRRTRETSGDRPALARHILLTVTTLVLTLTCFDSASAGDHGAFFVAKWGSEGSQDSQFEGPSGIAFDHFGSIYVADRGNNRIKKYTPTGELLTQWGEPGSGDGQFTNPRGIAIDSSNNIYVADEGNHRIQIFNSSGAFIQKIGSFGTGSGQFKNPYAVAVRGSDIYVADSYNHRIQRFQYVLVNWPPIFKSMWGTLGYGDGQFNAPSGIAVDNAGNVLVADTNNNRIQKFDASNNYVTKWGSFGSADGQLKSPRGIGVDDNGVVYVADYYNHRIQKYFTTGTLLDGWGSSGTGDGQFRFPSFVAVYDTCTIAVSDTSNHRVQRFACDNSTFYDKWGNLGTEDGEFNSPRGIAVDGAGNIYVVDTNNNRIQKFTSTGAFLLKWGHLGTEDGEFYHPAGITVDRFGYIYVADRDNNRIQKFTPAGDYLAKWSGAGDESLSHPTSVAVDINFNAYVVDDVKVRKFTSFGTFVDFVHPVSNIHIGLIYPTSVLSETGSYLNSIYITADVSGDVISGILRFRPISSSQTGYFYLGQQGGHFDGLALDSDHSFYSFNSSTNRIQKFTSSFDSAAASTFGFFYEWGGPGTGNGRFNSPGGIAVDKDFNVYVVDTQNHRIQKFSVAPCVTCSLPN